MASLNPFDLLGVDDSEDPSQLVAVVEQKSEAAAQTDKKEEVPSKNQSWSDGRNESHRGSGLGRRGGRGQGSGDGCGQGGRGYDRVNSNSSYNRYSGGFDGGKVNERRGRYGGGFHGVRRGDFRNGDVSNGNHGGRCGDSRFTFERHSGSGRGNHAKREGSGLGNWGTAGDDIFIESKELVNELDKTVGKQDDKPDADTTESYENKELSDEQKERVASRIAERLAFEMTLDEYEKVLEEKRKALQALKSEERMVDSEEFSSLKLLSNKKKDDEVFVKLGTDKDKRKEAVVFDKAKRSVKTNEFLNLSEGVNSYCSGDRGGGRGRGGRGRGGKNDSNNVEVAPSLADKHQFPTLCAKNVTGSNQSASMVNSHPLHANFTSSLAPPLDPINGNGLGIRSINIDSGRSDFLSWINGKGPFVPLLFTPDSIPKVVRVNEPFPGWTNEMFVKRSRTRQTGPSPSPLITIDLSMYGCNSNSAQGCETSKAPTVALGKHTRFNKALSFQKHFTNSGIMEKGTCISSSGRHSWTDKSCGIVWVAVQGMDSICVATRNEELEHVMKQRMLAFELQATKEELLDVFMQGIVYKVQDLADPLLDQSIKNKKRPNGRMYVGPLFSSMRDQSIKKPLGVVSVIQGHEVSHAEYDEEKAVKFLEAEIKSNTTLTFDETVQTAISALQHLFCKYFKPNEIRAIVWKEDGGLVKELPPRRLPSCWSLDWVDYGSSVLQGFYHSPCLGVDMDLGVRFIQSF